MSGLIKEQIENSIRGRISDATTAKLIANLELLNKYEFKIADFEEMFALERQYSKKQPTISLSKANGAFSAVQTARKPKVFLQHTESEKKSC